MKIGGRVLSKGMFRVICHVYGGPLLWSLGSGGGRWGSHDLSTSRLSPLEPGTHPKRMSHILGPFGSVYILGVILLTALEI